MTDITVEDESGPVHWKVQIMQKWAQQLEAHARRLHGGDEDLAFNKLVRLGARVAVAAEPRPPGPPRAYIVYQGKVLSFTGQSPRSLQRLLTIVRIYLGRWHLAPSLAVTKEFIGDADTRIFVDELVEYWGHNYTDTINRLIGYGVYADRILRARGEIHLVTDAGERILRFTDL